MQNKKLTALLVFLLTASFYLFTLSPSLAWGDGVKLQTEVISGESFLLSEMTSREFSPDPYPFARVGVTAWDHPLYIIAGHALVKALPAIDSLWLINSLSAIFGAVSVTLVFLFCLRFTGSLLASGFAAFTLAVSHTFWWHSTTPEVYTLFIFLLLVSLLLFDHYERNGRIFALAGSAFFLGLAASNHALAFLAAVALCLYWLVKRKALTFRVANVQVFILPALGLITGFSVFLIQFIRMARKLPFTEIIGPIVGVTFLSQLSELSLGLLGASVLKYFVFLLLQFNPLGVILGMHGVRKAITGKDTLAAKIVACFAIYTLFGIFYLVTDQFAFFLTSYVFFAILMGIGLADILDSLQMNNRFALTVLLVLTIALTPFLYRVLPDLARSAGMDDAALGIPQVGTGVRDGLAYYINSNKRGDYTAYQFGSDTLAKLPPDSVVFAEWYADTDEYFVLRYFIKINGLRPDVTILGWPTHDPFTFDPHLALDTVAVTFPHRPLYLASLSDRYYAASELIDIYCIVPENNLYRLYEKGDATLDCLLSDSITE